MPVIGMYVSPRWKYKQPSILRAILLNIPNAPEPLTAVAAAPWDMSVLKSAKA